MRMRRTPAAWCRARPGPQQRAREGAYYGRRGRVREVRPDHSGNDLRLHERRSMRAVDADDLASTRTISIAVERGRSRTVACLTDLAGTSPPRSPSICLNCASPAWSPTGARASSSTTHSPHSPTTTSANWCARRCPTATPSVVDHRFIKVRRAAALQAPVIVAADASNGRTALASPGHLTITVTRRFGLSRTGSGSTGLRAGSPSSD